MTHSERLHRLQAAVLQRGLGTGCLRTGTTATSGVVEDSHEAIGVGGLRHVELCHGDAPGGDLRRKHGRGEHHRGRAHLRDFDGTAQASVGVLRSLALGQRFPSKGETSQILSTQI